MGEILIDIKKIKQIMAITGITTTNACKRSYELGYLEGKLAGILKAEELLKPVQKALDEDKSNAY